MAGNTVRKIAPFIDTDIFAAESWLSDMAAKGLFFKEGAFWWNLVFEKGEPAKRRYRLVPAEPMELYTITTGEMSVYESAGIMPEYIRDAAAGYFTQKMKTPKKYIQTARVLSSFTKDSEARSCCRQF